MGDKDGWQVPGRAVLEEEASLEDLALENAPGKWAAMAQKASSLPVPPRVAKAKKEGEAKEGGREEEEEKKKKEEDVDVDVESGTINAHLPGEYELRRQIGAQKRSKKTFGKRLGKAADTAEGWAEVNRSAKEAQEELEGEGEADVEIVFG